MHAQAKLKLEHLTEFVRITNDKVLREVTDLDSHRFTMKLLVYVREEDSSMEIAPIMDMYHMLEFCLPAGFMDKDETDCKTILRTNWKKLLKQCVARTEELCKTQTKHKRTLLKFIKDFKVDVVNFREDFLKTVLW